MKIGKNSLWVCYSLMNSFSMKDMIPPGLEIAKVSPIQCVTPREMLLFNAYEVSCNPWMKGARTEILTFVRNKKSGTPHFVVLDVLTDTMNWDPINGITKPNSIANIKRTSGVDVTFHGKDRFSVTGEHSNILTPSYTFIVDANRKCFFGNFEKGYKMDFDEKEIMNPVTKLKDLKIENTCWKEFRGEFIIAFKHNTPMEFNVHVNPFKLDC